MYEFTAKDAREIVAKESFTSRGWVIDQIKKAAKNNQQSITIPELKLTDVDKAQFIKDGFSITRNTISWKEKTSVAKKESSKNFYF